MEEQGQQASEAKAPAKGKLIVLSQAAVIVILLIAFAYVYSENQNYKKTQEVAAYSLLSTKLYYGAGPKSFTIISFDPLRAAMQDYINKNNVNASIYVENLRNGASFGINSRTAAFPASINKLPVAILIMEKVEAGKLALDSEIPISNSFVPSNSVELRNGGEAILTANEPLYIYTNNKQLPLRMLMENMLEKSDNNAFNVLLTQIDKTELTQLLHYLDIDVDGSYDPAKVLDGDLLGPKFLSNIFRSLYYSTVLEPSSSEYLLSLLVNTTFNIGQIAQIPGNVLFSDKYGAYNLGGDNVFHDCGIMYIDASRVLYCITVRGQDEASAIRTTASLLRGVYDYVVTNRAQLDIYKNRGYL